MLAMILLILGAIYLFIYWTCRITTIFLQFSQE